LRAVVRPALMTTPAAPVLSHDGSNVTASFDDAPQKGDAMLYFAAENGDGEVEKQFYDAEKSGIIAVGQIGKLIQLTGFVTSVNVTNLKGDVEYTATIAYRGAGDVEFGSTSPASAPLKILSPVAPEAPLLEAMSSKAIRVYFVASPLCEHVDMLVDVNGTCGHRVSPDLTLESRQNHGKTITAFQSKCTSFIVTGLEETDTYRFSLLCHNGCWGPRGPWSKPLKLANHVPKPPGAPFLDKITQDSVRVSFSMMASVSFSVGGNCSRGTILFKKGSTIMAVDNATNTLVNQPTCKAIPASKGKDGFVVSSLLPNTDYEVSLRAGYQGFSGWSKTSPSRKFRTLPAEVEITGTKTQEERDAELRKNAVDVDTDDEPPPPNSDSEADESEPPTAKRAKKEKK